MADDQHGQDETVVRPDDPNATHTSLGGSGGAGASDAGGPPGPPVPPGPPGPPGTGASGPPSSGGNSGAGASSGGSSGSALKRRNQRAATIAIALLVAIVAGLALAVSGGGSDRASAAEITRESFDSTGANPFSGTVVVPDVTIPKTIPNVPGAPSFPPPLATGGSIPTVSAATPGLYGGTQQLSVCDVKQLVSFLQSNAEKAAAWAKVVGITPADIPSYVDELTSVILRSDTRVTNHGFANGAATDLQSVLQAGTAVLVDKFGVPRVRCYCGNPLTSPEPVTPTYTGPTWEGFNPGQVTVIVASPTPIINIVLINIVDGTTFQRPIGTDGGSDVKVTLVPKGGTSTSSSTTTTKPSSSTSTPSGSSSTQAAAIKIIHDALDKCIADLKAQGRLENDINADLFKYQAQSAGGTAFTVTVTGVDGTSQGNWKVDPKTGEVTPTDQIATATATNECPGAGLG